MSQAHAQSLDSFSSCWSQKLMINNQSSAYSTLIIWMLHTLTLIDQPATPISVLSATAVCLSDFTNQLRSGLQACSLVCSLLSSLLAQFPDQFLALSFLSVLSHCSVSAYTLPTLLALSCGFIHSVSALSLSSLLARFVFLQPAILGSIPPPHPHFHFQAISICN